MRTGISVSVSAADRRRLEAIVADPKTPQKHVWRSRIILLTADRIGTTAIMAATGKSKTCVWRWQERFMQAGVDGLLRDKTRPPGKAPVAADRVASVVRLTLASLPHEATHWTARAMAEASGLAVETETDTPLRMTRNRTCRTRRESPHGLFCPGQSTSLLCPRSHGPNG